MKTQFLIIIPTILVGLLSGCATQQTSLGGPEVAAQLRKYDTAAVLDFADRTSGQPAEHRAAAAAAGGTFADKIALQIRRTSSFQTVTRTKAGGDALVISGEILEYDPGSFMTRSLFGWTGAGKSHFAATIDLSDNRTGRRIHRIPVGRSSETPLPTTLGMGWAGGDVPELSMLVISESFAKSLAQARDRQSESTR